MPSSRATKGLFAKAEEELSNAVEPADPACRNLQDAYEARGRSRMAEDAFTRALQVRPGHPAAVEGLARVRARP